LAGVFALFFFDLLCKSTVHAADGFGFAKTLRWHGAFCTDGFVCLARDFFFYVFRRAAPADRSRALRPWHGAKAAISGYVEHL